MTHSTETAHAVDNARNQSLPSALSAALKEWAVAIGALREGRQILLLRKGGIREEGGEFEVQTRDVLLFPTYEHQMEQAGMLQPCYGAWLQEEQRRKPADESVRMDTWAQITDILIVRDFSALYTLKSQHIYDDALLRFRTENEPHKPLYALFLRAYELPAPVTIPMELDYYGCKSWISLTEPVSTGTAKPVLSDHTYAERVRVTRRLLEEMSLVPFELPENLAITWFGHATFLVQLPNGKRLLIDPWLTGNPSTPADKKDPGTVDLMLLTHGHGDHIGDAAAIAKKTGCTIAAVPEIAAYLGTKGVDENKVSPMNKGGTVRFDELGLTVTMTMAFHTGGINDGDTVLYGGEPGGFVVTLDSRFAFYHAGDTCVFSDMSLIAEMYRPSLAFLPIGDRFTMGPREAAKAAQFLSTVRAIIPMHYGTFPLLTGTPDALKEALVTAGAVTEVITMTPGQTLEG